MTPIEPCNATRQIAHLAEFIARHEPGEPSRSESAIDTAIRLLRKAYEPVNAAGAGHTPLPDAPDPLDWQDWSCWCNGQGHERGANMCKYPTPVYAELADGELAAMQTLVAALEPLDQDRAARSRVLQWAIERYGRTQ